MSDVRTQQGKGTSPFVAMTTMQRAVVVLFVLVYNALVPGFSEVLHQPSLPLAVLRFGTELVYQGLLVLPFVYYKPGFGWLHPLIFTVIWALAREFVAEPDALLAPIQVFAEPLHPELSHQGLAGYTEQEVAWTLVKAKGIQCVSLVAYYLGFFSGLRPAVPKLTFQEPRQVQLRTILLVGGAALIFLLAVQAQGGIIDHFISLGTGRQRAIGGLGHLTILIRLGVIASVAWYAFDRKAGRNPLFWGTLLIALTCIFLWSGSRSDVIFPLAFLLIIRALRYKTIPWMRGAVVGATALVLFGGLGALRTSTMTGEPAWEIVTDLQISRSLEFADEQLQRRERNPGGGYTAIVGRVPEDVDLLYGRTYVGALLFFVPRALWADKPRATGAYVNKYLYGTMGSTKLDDSPPKVGGIPSGHVGAAYWNFYIPGVIFLFSLYGIFHRWLARFYEINENALGVVLFLYLVTGVGVSPNALVSVFQNIVLVLGTLFFLGAIKLPQKALKQNLDALAVLLRG